MNFDSGLSIQSDIINMDFLYGTDCFGPQVEKRSLDSIRQSLSDPESSGPEIVYAIAMDVGQTTDRQDLLERNLLFGVVIFASGQVGNEPVRSQGHIHSVSKSCGSSTPEVYEIWQGKCIVYMQERVESNPGTCYAVRAEPGDTVIVPPGWGHMTVSGDTETPLVFGAWCVRDYAFEYGRIREYGGLAWYPEITSQGKIEWIRNNSYLPSSLIEKSPGNYEELMDLNLSIYKQYQINRNQFDFVCRPSMVNWADFVP